MAFRALIIASILLIAVTAVEDKMMTRFQEFKVQYHRKYANEAEEKRKFRIFSANMKKAANLMKQNPLAKFGENEYADFSELEFKPYHTLLSAPSSAASCTVKRSPGPNPPTSIDWRQKGAVTPIKNQGQCGSCWAFSTTGNIEGQWFLAGNTLTSLSEQEIVSCDTDQCQGCNGGYPLWAYEWLLQDKQGKLATEKSYPYTSGDGITGSCKGDGVTGATINGCESLVHNEHYMANWTATFGPISICINANAFQTYQSGILTDCPKGQIDHCVLIVGYDIDNKPPYWIIKNSWGTSWGEKGYIQVEMWKDECSLTSNPTSVYVKKA